MVDVLSNVLVMQIHNWLSFLKQQHVFTDTTWSEGNGCNQSVKYELKANSEKSLLGKKYVLMTPDHTAWSGQTHEHTVTNNDFIFK